MNNENLYALFLERFPNDPSALFLDGVDGRQLYYGEVAQRSGRMLGLLQRYGVTKGDRVVVQVDKSIEAVLLYLACLRAGAIYIPLNTAYTPHEVGYFLQDAAPRLFVCTPAGKEVLASVAHASGVPELLSLGSAGDGDLPEALESIPESDQIVDVTGKDLAAILYTSGTTGRSKGAMLSHANLASNAQVLFDYWRCSKRTSCCTRCRYSTCMACLSRCIVPCWVVPGDIHAALRCSDGNRQTARDDRDDGRADLLYPVARARGFHPRQLCKHATVHLRVCPPAGRNAP